MRQRRLASSNLPNFDFRPRPTTINDVPLARGSEASTVSKAPTWMTHTTSSTTRTCDSLLIPDTDSDCIPSRIPSLEPQSRRSTWDKYLFDTAVQRQSYERDRLQLRRNILRSMDIYYGHDKWQKVDSLEEVQLVDPDRSLRNYLGRLVLYGEASKRRSRYVDRKNRVVEKSAFKRRRMSWDESKIGFFEKLKERLHEDFRELKL